jgi:hypothetical protein
VSSPLISKVTPTHCLEFAYFMYGDKPGTLTAFTKFDPFTPPMPVFTRTGSYGNYWLLASIQFNYDTQLDISVC